MREDAPDTSDAMKRYKAGKAGFTDIAHLKAKGLIARSDGEKKKSAKYKQGDIMLRVYMLIIVVGLIGGVVYGAYAYYNDTQQRIKTLQENNAKLETVAKTNELTINSLQESQERFATLNNELQTKLNLALTYGDDLRKKLHKHDLTRLSIKKPGLIEKRINNGTKKLFDNIESLTAHPVIEQLWLSKKTRERDSCSDS